MFGGTAYGESAAAETPAPLGPEPDTEDIRSVLLRDSSVVLRKGACDIEAGLDYRRRDIDFSTTGRDLTRMVLLPLTLRIGLSEGVEGFLSAPLVYGEREFSDGETRQTDSDFGPGDVAAGISMQLAREKPGRPEMVGSLQVRAPTGADSYSGDGTGVALGSGHWAVATGVQFVRTSDPVVLYWGVGYSHQFETQGLGRDIQPGENLDYSMGIGLAVNNDLTLSALFSGAYQDDVEIDGEPVKGSAIEPMRMRLAVTQRWRRNVFVESYVSFGLNDDAPETIAGTAVISRLGL